MVDKDKGTPRVFADCHPELDNTNAVGLQSADRATSSLTKKESTRTSAKEDEDRRLQQHQQLGAKSADKEERRHLPDGGKKELNEARKAASKWKQVTFKSNSQMNLYQVVQSLPPGYIARSRGSEVIQPTVDGMRQFGLNKGEITRAIVKFSTPPTAHPLTVCFHFPSTFLTHRYVLDMVRSLIQEVEGARVTTIQFVDRNTIHGARGLDNRWLVSLSALAARDVLLSEGLQLFNRHIVVRKYDDILREEYKEFVEYTKIMGKMFVKKEDVAVKQNRK